MRRARIVIPPSIGITVENIEGAMGFHHVREWQIDLSHRYPSRPILARRQGLISRSLS